MEKVPGGLCAAFGCSQKETHSSVPGERKESKRKEERKVSDFTPGLCLGNVVKTTPDPRY